MSIRHKTKAWVHEFAEIFRGTALQMIYRKPPDHYLGYIENNMVPVIMIPGIMGRWAYMKSLSDRISLRGHPVHIVEGLKQNIFDIPFSSEILKSLLLDIFPISSHLHKRMLRDAKIIRDHIERHDLKGVVLVAHSKGGLIGKHYLIHHNHDDRVLGLVAMATPFSGSKLATLVPHKAFQELRTDSKVINELKTHKNVNHQIISVFPVYDTHVRSDWGSFLEGAENIEVPVHGHNIILKNKHFQQVVIESVDKISHKAKSHTVVS